jgi:hypothetical protein
MDWGTCEWKRTKTAPQRLPAVRLSRPSQSSMGLNLEE